MSTLKNVRDLDLRRNEIEDISVLLDLDSLEVVRLQENPLNEESAAVIDELRSRGCDVM